MAHSLITAYNLTSKMSLEVPTYATFKEMTKFHTDEYIDFLRRVKPDDTEDIQRYQAKFNLGWWTPSRKKGEASGFCYVNDIVLGILELLRVHDRVLYIDTDVHHGDGVEEAFFTSDRVMTVSFHKFGEFFPGQGLLMPWSTLLGNVPLHDGIDDESYHTLFKNVMTAVMERFRPGAHERTWGKCGVYEKVWGAVDAFGGWGVYDSECGEGLVFETALACGVEIPDVMPYHTYFDSYGPECKILESLRHVPHAPSVQHQEIPLDCYSSDEDEDLSDRDDEPLPPSLHPSLSSSITNFITTSSLPSHRPPYTGISHKERRSRPPKAEDSDSDRGGEGDEEDEGRVFMGMPVRRVSGVGLGGAVKRMSMDGRAVGVEKVTEEEEREIGEVMRGVGEVEDVGMKEGDEGEGGEEGDGEEADEEAEEEEEEEEGTAMDEDKGE
ncbi:hypothetical protein BC829DRAFT_488211 [Chytridium lagenaria]|nr:hypothetical protein BC829DRAFT_488211 [Chytridium lagenaria]